MKTLNMQISLSTYQLLSDNGELNPKFIKNVLDSAFQDIHEEDYNISQGNMDCEYVDIVSKLSELIEPTVKYALKVNDEIHKMFKRTALDNDITLSELSGRLFEKYYNEVK